MKPSRNTLNRPMRQCAAFFAAAAAVAAFSQSPATAADNVVQCANLIYAGTNTSRCFSDAFLSAVQLETAISTERRFKAVKLSSKELFEFPFVIMTGENDFRFTSSERENLKRYLASGGFLLASAGCSNSDWDKAFRRELRLIFEDSPLATIPQDHPVFRTVHEITELRLKSGARDAALEGIELNGKLVTIYSRHGLNDTAHTQGCCCCGGNEILNSLQVNVNIFAYALLY